jgi:hypothetical protein
MLKFSTVDDPGMGDGDTAFAVDEQSQRHLVDMELGTDGIVADGNGVIHAGFRHERLYNGGAFSVHIDADDLEALGAVALIEGDVPGDFNLATTAIDSPEIEKDNAASVLGECELLSFEIGKQEIGRELSGFCRNEGIRSIALSGGPRPR